MIHFVATGTERAFSDSPTQFSKRFSSITSSPALLSQQLLLVITHASHVCSQNSFVLPLRMNGMHRTGFDHVRLDLPSLVICNLIMCVLTICHVKLRQSTAMLTFDRCFPHCVTFDYC